MKTRILFITVVLILFKASSLTAQESDSLWAREYQFNIYTQNDLRNSSIHGLTANRLLTDMYRKNVKPLMNEKIGNLTYDIFSFAATYMTMLWSHEFGHFFRARQVEGEFRIHNAGLPIPYTTMHLPENITYENEALSVTGGFEVNYLNVRSLQREFISNNGAYNEDLGYSFANRLLYPLYASIIVPINPEEQDVWINTAGDPVHCVLPVFKNYSNDKVFMDDGSVNPELVKFYNQSALFGSFFNLLDPHFYSEIGASFGKKGKTRRPKFLIGNHDTGWTYGTLFSVSPLGYELYFNNYLHIKGNQFSFYAKYGNPYKNNGFGARWGNMVANPKLNMALTVDLWDQDIFGKGIAGELETKYHISDKIAFNMTLGYKTEGFVLGREMGKGVTFGGGIIIRGSYY